MAKKTKAKAKSQTPKARKTAKPVGRTPFRLESKPMWMEAPAEHGCGECYLCDKRGGEGDFDIGLWWSLFGLEAEDERPIERGQARRVRLVIEEL